jgi:hypothetical protein
VTLQAVDQVREDEAFGHSLDIDFRPALLACLAAEPAEKKDCIVNLSLMNLVKTHPDLLRLQSIHAVSVLITPVVYQTECNSLPYPLLTSVRSPLCGLCTRKSETYHEAR